MTLSSKLFYHPFSSVNLFVLWTSPSLMTRIIQFAPELFGCSQSDDVFLPQSFSHKKSPQPNTPILNASCYNSAIMLGLLLVSAPLVYYRRRCTVSMSGVGAQRIPTNSRF